MPAVAVGAGDRAPGAPVGGEPGVGEITTPGGVGVTLTPGVVAPEVPDVEPLVPPEGT